MTRMPIRSLAVAGTLTLSVAGALAVVGPAAVGGPVAAAQTATSTLLITEYVEGTSFNKAVGLDLSGEGGGDDGGNDDDDDNDDGGADGGFLGFLGSLDLFGSLGR